MPRVVMASRAQPSPTAPSETTQKNPLASVRSPSPPDACFHRYRAKQPTGTNQISVETSPPPPHCVRVRYDLRCFGCGPKYSTVLYCTVLYRAVLYPLPFDLQYSIRALLNFIRMPVYRDLPLSDPLASLMISVNEGEKESQRDRVLCSTYAVLGPRWLVGC